MYDITLQQLETFLTVAKCANLSKAAELLSYSQPALSKSLRNLENSVKIQLFTRSNQGMCLTPEGENFLSIIEPLYNNLSQGIQYVQLNTTMPEKTLNIAAPSLFDYSEDFNTVKDIIRRYGKKYSDVSVQERLCDFAELRQALFFGNADFIITEDFVIQDMQDIVTRPVNELQIYLLISSDHRLAQSDQLDFSALSEETLYIISTFNEEVDTKTQLDICHKLGITPNRIEVLPNFETLMHMVILGKGVCLSEKLASVSSIRYYPVQTNKAPYIVVAWRNGSMSRQAANFIRMLPEFGVRTTTRTSSPAQHGKASGPAGP